MCVHKKAWTSALIVVGSTERPASHQVARGTAAHAARAPVRQQVSGHRPREELREEERELCQCKVDPCAALRRDSVGVGQEPWGPHGLADLHCGHTVKPAGRPVGLHASADQAAAGQQSSLQARPGQAKARQLQVRHRNRRDERHAPSNSRTIRPTIRLQKAAPPQHAQSVV